MIYLDHAATSWPKPPVVIEAVTRALDTCGNPGRGGHPLALAAGRTVLDAREAVASLLGVPDPARLAFTRNATEAMNLALRGLLLPGDRVCVTPLEHNAVMRPLRLLERQGVSITILPADADGLVDLTAARTAIAGARLVVACHGSNVLGTLQPLDDLGELAHAAGALFLADVSQTAGAMPLPLADLPVDFAAFPGHKSLLGPQGTGGLYIRPGLSLPALLAGGTGSLSEQEEMPDFAPDRYEAGTPNVPGLAGLGAAASYLAGIGLDQVRKHEESLVAQFLEGLRFLPVIRVLGLREARHRAGLVSLSLAEVSPDILAQALEDGYGICTRAGLHCAPAAHRHAGTWPVGAVRFSFGYSTTAAEVEEALAALRTLVAGL
ncbi:MAG TPA: aminotransferase class V-fold PLP-dependent enzyme [Symbiobacteriaceae bacterium]